jgi:hypothetical protein
VVHFDIKDLDFCIWAEIHKENFEWRERIFQVYGTGADIPPNSQYISTVLTEYYVWHLYEVL